MEYKSVINTLENLKVGACRTEKVALSQAIDDVKKMHKIRKWVKDKENETKGVNPWQE